jgi:endonuclease YncB( thermonuclease family)
MFALLLLAGSPVFAADLVGRGHVIDGDTLTLETRGGASVTIRLAGIDAPEAAQTCSGATGAPFPCGDEASAALIRIIAGRELRCEPTPGARDRYRRTVATCFAGQVDVGREMVLAGEAVAFRRYSLAYVADEDQARVARRGLWRGEFTMPADWRRTHH